MKSELRPSMLAAVGALMGIALAAYPTDAGSEASSSLAAPESFASIADEGQRSAAYFTELGKVLLNPRCVNCHPAGDRPRQGDLARLHQPPVERGADGFGVPGMRCSSCHQATNFGRVPGHPDWHLAPLAMAW
jgi:cytochrome c5